jgi:predicted metal-binding protein
MAVGAIVVAAFEVWWDVALIEGLWSCDLCKETAIEYVLDREYVSPKTAAIGMNLRVKIGSRRYRINNV